MKKSIILSVLVVLAALSASAQMGIGLGIKAGANFANQNVQDISTKTVTNFLAGAYLNLNLTEKFGITPEVLYSAQGSKREDITFNFNYIAIPVMLRVKPVKPLYIEAGPQFSFLTKAHVENVGDVMDQFKKNDFGVAFGAGVNLPLGLNAGARYVLGFTNISDASGSTIKNRTFQLFVGWTLFGAK